MFTQIFTLSNLVLVVALTLSVIAAWYSIIGLIAIFAAAAIPIIIMGGALEVAKVVTTVWLHRYWDRITWLYKLYLLPAVIILAFITSMGIFGFLSKAHMDQGLVSGDVQSKIAIYDEKIKISKENIDANRAALKQLDAAVDQIMGRSTTESGAERSVQIRRQQGPERQRLLREIETEQKKISELNEARAPIAAEVRKVEAEVGPIKYIAALIYGDNPDQNLLEKAVRYVIILLVIVFDPLALILVVASNTSRKWDKLERDNSKLLEEPSKVNDFGEQTNQIVPEQPDPEEPQTEQQVEQTYLYKRGVYKVPGINVGPQIYMPPKHEVEELKCNICDSKLEKVGNLGLFCSNINCKSYENYSEPVEEVKEEVKSNVEIATTGVTKQKPYRELEGGYVLVDDKAMSKSAAVEMHPEWFALTADSGTQISTNFGTLFPKMANKGEMFVRVDVLPNRVFKFDGVKWIEVKKGNSDSYLYDKKYIEYLIKEIELGKYDVELLTDVEKSLIENYLKSQ